MHLVCINECIVMNSLLLFVVFELPCVVWIAFIPFYPLTSLAHLWLCMHLDSKLAGVARLLSLFASEPLANSCGRFFLLDPQDKCRTDSLFFVSILPSSFLCPLHRSLWLTACLLAWLLLLGGRRAACFSAPPNHIWSGKYSACILVSCFGCCMTHCLYDLAKQSPVACLTGRHAAQATTSALPHFQPHAFAHIIHYIFWYRDSALSKGVSAVTILVKQFCLRIVSTYHMIIYLFHRILFYISSRISFMHTLF